MEAPPAQPGHAFCHQRRGKASLVGGSLLIGLFVSVCAYFLLSSLSSSEINDGRSSETTVPTFSSDFSSIIISRLLSADPGNPSVDRDTRAPLACLVVVVTDGDTLRCVPVASDIEVSAHLTPDQRRALSSTNSALVNLPEVYVNRTTLPKLRLDPWPSRCVPLDSCTLKVRLYGIDAPEMNKGGSRAPPRSLQIPPGLLYGSAPLDVGGQPLGVAAAAALADAVLGRVVLIQSLQKDRYNRILARVVLPLVTDRAVEGPLAFDRYFKTLFSHIALISAQSTVPLGASFGPSKEALINSQRLTKALEQGPPFHAFSLARETLRLLLGAQAPDGSFGGHKWRPGEGEAFLLATLEERDPLLLIDMSDLMLRRGLSSLYTGGGRVYAGRKEKLMEHQKSAQDNRMGIWALPDELRETPAGYKRRTRMIQKPSITTTTPTGQRGSQMVYPDGSSLSLRDRKGPPPPDEQMGPSGGP